MGSSSNYYNSLCEDENECFPEPTRNSAKDWEDNQIVLMSNFKEKDMQSTENKIRNMEIEVINNVTRVVNKPKLNQAIGDTGTTGNFVQPEAPVDNTYQSGNKSN